jgi:hypothetical protein
MSEYTRLVEKYTDMLAAAKVGNYHARADLKEAISTSDFPAIFADIKSAQLQNRYTLAENRIWKKIARRVTVPNFLPQSFYDWDIDYEKILRENGGITTIPGTLPNIPENTEYPSAYLVSSEEQFQIRKAGVRWPFTFEAIINDQWGLVDSLPDSMLRVAIDSEDGEVTRLLTDGDGVNAAYFNAGNENLLVYGTNTDGQAALTRETLKAAIKQANSRTYNGAPVRFSKFALVVPTALVEEANDILAVKEFLVQDGNLQYREQNNFGAAIEVVENPWLQVADLTHGATGWYVVPFAGEGVRMSLALGFLENYEEPEVRVHNDTGLLLGGGTVNPRSGNFRADAYEIRLRHIFGGVALNAGIGTVGSTGQAAPTTA